MLSTTSFTDKPVTFAVMYGCTDNIMEDTSTWLKRCGASVFHPLVLPMVFAEHERKRLFNEKDKLHTELGERILELENRVRKDKEKGQQTDKTEGQQTMTQRDCEAINLWTSMSSLKNGLESLHTELGSMKDHLHTLSESSPELDDGCAIGQGMSQATGIYIDARLKDMMTECRSKIRSCEGLLGSMSLATQMVCTSLFPFHVHTVRHNMNLRLYKEWNYYTRRDAQVNYSIATATRMDSSQMKQISLLGMIYLPGTFLAVSCLPSEFGSAAHTKPDLLLNDLF